MGGKGSWWSQVSHRKLKISIWVASILGDTAKDALLRYFRTTLISTTTYFFFTELEEDSGLIDGEFYFSRSLIPKISMKPLQVGDNVQYKGG